MTYRYPLIKFMMNHLEKFTEEEVAKIFIALHIASNIHGETRRKTGELYIEHCLFVAATLWRWGLGADAIIVGLLHDVVEDCPKDSRHQLKRDIAEKFGTLVLKAVLYLTKTDKAKYPKRLVRGAAFCQIVAFTKLADRTHNLITVPQLQDNRSWQISYLEETMAEIIPALVRCGSYIPADLVIPGNGDRPVRAYILYWEGVARLVKLTKSAIHDVLRLQPCLPLFS